MENNVSTGVFQKHENNELTHVFLAFTQGKCQINRTFSDNRKRTVYIGFTWYSPFSKINGERGFSCRVNDRCKIVSDFFIKIMFQSLLVSQCKVFFSETVCFNLYYLCFYYYLLARNFLVSCCNCSPNLVGFFANIACCKKKMLFRA